MPQGRNFTGSEFIVLRVIDTWHWKVVYIAHLMLTVSSRLPPVFQKPKSLWTEDWNVVVVVSTLNASVRCIFWHFVYDFVFFLATRSLPLFADGNSFRRRCIELQFSDLIRSVCRHWNVTFVHHTTQWTIKKRDILFLTITLANLNRFL